jgi:hypothetical protein
VVPRTVRVRGHAQNMDAAGADLNGEEHSAECSFVRLGSGIRIKQAELTPGLAATLRHAASMHNPLFYERQRMRASTWNIPRFLHSYDETALVDT